MNTNQESAPSHWFYDDHRNRRLEARDYVATLAIAAEALAEFLAHHEGHPLSKCDRAALVAAVAGRFNEYEVRYGSDFGIPSPWQALRDI